MSMYRNFKTDPDLERKGVELDYSDFVVTVARAGGSNKRYVKLLQAAARPLRRQIQSETLDEETSRSMLIDVYSKSIILNWEIKNKDGKLVQGIEVAGDIVPFNRENVEAVLREVPDLFLDIQQQASLISLFLEEERETDLGN